MEINFFKAKKNLTILWLISFGVLFFFFFMQTVEGRFDYIEEEAWEWFLPNVLPSITLICGGFVLKETQGSRIKRIYYHLSFWLSFGYIVLLFIVLISYTSEKGKILDYYENFDIPLKALQPIITLSLGMFFIKKNNSSD